MVNEASSKIRLTHAEPVLPVTDILKTIAYWKEVLGFPDTWTWGDPPNHGGASWSGACFVQFSLDPEWTTDSKGHAVWIRVKNLDALHTLHTSNGAKIVRPLSKMPWGLSEYIIQEGNGHYIIFSAPATEENKSEAFSGEVRIVSRKPTLEEHTRLATAVGWTSEGVNPNLKNLLDRVVFGAVAEDKNGNAVGCALVLSDGVGIYHIKDVMIDPAWQRRNIGTAIMQVVNNWIDNNAPNQATVGLFTGENLAGFYGQFGFVQATGMYKVIKRNNDPSANPA